MCVHTRGWGFHRFGWCAQQTSHKTSHKTTSDTRPYLEEQDCPKNDRQWGERLKKARYNERIDIVGWGGKVGDANQPHDDGSDGQGDLGWQLDPFDERHKHQKDLSGACDASMVALQCRTSGNKLSRTSITEPQGPWMGMATGVDPDGMPGKGAAMLGAKAGARTGASLGARASIRPGAIAGAIAGSRLTSSRRIWTMLSIISCGTAIIEAPRCQRQAAGSDGLARASLGGQHPVSSIADDTTMLEYSSKQGCAATLGYD